MIKEVAASQKAWAEVEAQFMERGKEPVPEGWVTARMYAEEKGITATTASTRLKNMYLLKLVDRKPWRAPGVNATLYIYKPK